VIVIVAVVAVSAAFAAVDWDLIVPATATTAPVRPVRANTVVAVVSTVKVLSVSLVIVYVPLTEASTLEIVTLLPVTNPCEESVMVVVVDPAVREAAVTVPAALVAAEAVVMLAVS
jgi:hypothetical protein